MADHAQQHPPADSKAVLANGTASSVEALNEDFQRVVSHDRQNSGTLPPLRGGGADGEMPAAYSWRSGLPIDSPGTARASRRHRSEPFFIGVAGAALATGSLAHHALLAGPMP